MKKLKILYFTQDKTHSLIKDSEYFKDELKRRSDVDIRFIEKGGHIKEIMKELSFTPDFIYIDHYIDYRVNQEYLYGLKSVNIPKGVLICDLHHGNRFHFRKFVNHFQVDLVFSHYRDAFRHRYPDFLDKFRWLPLCINQEIYKDYRLPKTINYLVMGHISPRIYKLRNKIVHEMKDVHGFHYYEHPGYRDFSEEEGAIIGDRYAMKINSAKMFFTDDSVFKYPIGKYFEVPACKTLLLAPGSPELRDLGFINGETFVEINDQNFLKKALSYIGDQDEMNRITKNAYEMVRSRHTHEIRAGEFVKYVRDYLIKTQRW
ncbi:glycosyltransferase [Bacillus sp. AFS015802]|uniref:glycosyltransferase n=1 Tax=Bacillus sp. AFS015802 TaxID=2033486 RepID=UPI0015CF1E25|nr:glycosyltransferase [Bacillus sp. AFS015802]